MATYTVTLSGSWGVEAASPEEALEQAKWLFDCDQDANVEWSVADDAASQRVVVQMWDAELGEGTYHFLGPAGMPGKEAVALFDATVARVKEDEWYEFDDLVAALAPLGFSDPFDHPIFEAGVEW